MNVSRFREALALSAQAIENGFTPAAVMKKWILPALVGLADSLETLDQPQPSVAPPAAPSQPALEPVPTRFTESVLEYLGSGPRRAGEVGVELGFSKDTIKGLLDQMVTDGKIELRTGGWYVLPLMVDGAE